MQQENCLREAFDEINNQIRYFVVWRYSEVKEKLNLGNFNFSVSNVRKINFSSRVINEQRRERERNIESFGD